MPANGATKIGDKLYTCRTINRSGRGKWSESRIVDETKHSWLVQTIPGSSMRAKVNKTTMMTAADRQGMKDRYYTAQGRDAKDFCDKYARDIGAAVSVCDDPEKLKAIAAIIGKKLL